MNAYLKSSMCLNALDRLNSSPYKSHNKEMQQLANAGNRVIGYCLSIDNSRKDKYVCTVSYIPSNNNGICYEIFYAFN